MRDYDDGEVFVEADDNLVIEFADGGTVDLGVTPADFIAAVKADERETLRQLLAIHGLPTADTDGDADCGPDNPGWAKLTDAMFGTAWRGELEEDHGEHGNRAGGS